MELEKNIKVYIASPYTKGDPAVNVKRQLDMFDILFDLKFYPFAPLFTHFQHITHPRPYQDWVNFDLEWVKVCNCVLRMDGESSGADGEVEYADELGRPVFYNVDDLCKYYGHEITEELSEKAKNVVEDPYNV